MPRPIKAFKRQKVQAAVAWKKGEKKEAYALWEKAAAGRKAHLTKKKTKAPPAAEGGGAPVTP